MVANDFSGKPDMTGAMGHVCTIGYTCRLAQALSYEIDYRTIETCLGVVASHVSLVECEPAMKASLAIYLKVGAFAYLKCNS